MLPLPIEQFRQVPPDRRADLIRRMTPEQQQALALVAQTAKADRLRSFATSPDFCGLSDLSPMIAAIMDAADGVRPDTIDDATCERYFGCKLDELPTQKRRTVAVQAGGRGGKTSRLLSVKALHAAWTVPLPTLAHGEHAVALIVSSELVFAKQCFSFVLGYVENSPVLKAALVGEPGAESLTLRRPDGKLVDVRVRAAGAKGKGGRAFTLVFAGLDEACFFYDESGVVNDKEIHRAVAQRIVPGGQEWLVSTPWIAGVGVLEEQLAGNWGNHALALAVRGVGTRALNPTWDPTGEIEADLRKNDPDNAEREIDAKAIAAGSSHFFSHEAIEAALREDLPQQSPREPGRNYGCGGDAGFVKNSSALAIVGRAPATERTRETFRLARLEERKPKPGLPLQPKGVAGEFATVMLEYGERELVTDSHEIREVREGLLEKNVTAAPAPDKHEAFTKLRTILHEGRAEFPMHARLRAQLRQVLQRPMPGGGVQIYTPKAADGSHGDLVSALVNAVWKAAQGATPPVKPRSAPAGARASAFG